MRGPVAGSTVLVIAGVVISVVHMPHHRADGHKEIADDKGETKCAGCVDAHHKCNMVQYEKIGSTILRIIIGVNPVSF